MKKQQQPVGNDQEKDLNKNQTQTKKNTYTTEETQFADGEGTKLDQAIDSDESNPATRGE